MEEPIVMFILTIAGFVIATCFVIIGFFIARIVSDVKSNTANIGKNKGTIELVKQQQESDIEKIEKMTQLEIKVLSEKVGDLSTNVNRLVDLMVEQKKG